MKKLLLPALIACLYLVPAPARADARANINQDGQIFLAGNGVSGTNVRVDFQKGEAVILTPRGRRRVRIEEDLLKRGDLHVSEDGEWLVWMLKAAAYGAPGRQIKADTIVLIAYHGEREVRRVTYGETSFSHVEHSVSHIHWLGDFFVDFANLRVNLVELRDGARAIVHLDSAKIDKVPAPAPRPSSTPSSTPSSPLDAMRAASEQMAEISRWYQEETKKLASKADSMPDRELNQAMEKLTADYNRKLLKAQVAMAAAVPSPTPTSKTPPIKPISPPPAKMPEQVPVLCDFDVERLSFKLPSGRRPYVGRRVSESHYDFALLLVSDEREAATSIEIERVSGKNASPAAPKRIPDPKKPGLEIMTAKATYRFVLRYPGTDSKELLDSVEASFKVE